MSKTKHQKTSHEEPEDIVSMFPHLCRREEVSTGPVVIEGFGNAVVVEHKKTTNLFKNEAAPMPICPFCENAENFKDSVFLATPNTKENRVHYTCEAKNAKGEYLHPRIFVTQKFLSAVVVEFTPRRDSEKPLSNSKFKAMIHKYLCGLEHINWYCGKCNSVTLDYSGRLNSRQTESAWMGHFHYRCDCKKDNPKMIGIVSANNTFKNRLIPVDVQEFARQFVNYPAKFKDAVPDTTHKIASTYKPTLKRTFNSDYNKVDDGGDDSDQNYDSPELMIDDGK